MRRGGGRRVLSGRRLGLPERHRATTRQNGVAATRGEHAGSLIVSLTMRDEIRAFRAGPRRATNETAPRWLDRSGSRSCQHGSQGRELPIDLILKSCIDAPESAAL